MNSNSNPCRKELKERKEFSLSAPGGEGWGEVVPLPPFPLSPLLLFLVFTQLSTFNPQPLHAATFTTNALITEADTSFDGQDIVVSGATLTVDGRHPFNSLLLTNGAVLTCLRPPPKLASVNPTLPVPTRRSAIPLALPDGTAAPLHYW
jgi:hypothetical protein